MKLSKYKPLFTTSVMCALFYLVGSYLAGYYYLTIKAENGALDIFMLFMCVPFVLLLLLSYVIYQHHPHLISINRPFRYLPNFLVIFITTSLLLLLFDSLFYFIVDDRLSSAFANLLSIISSKSGTEVNIEAMNLVANWPYLLQNVVTHVVIIFLSVMIGLTCVWQKSKQDVRNQKFIDSP